MVFSENIDKRIVTKEIVQHSQLAKQPFIDRSEKDLSGPDPNPSEGSKFLLIHMNQIERRSKPLVLLISCCLWMDEQMEFDL